MNKSGWFKIMYNDLLTYTSLAEGPGVVRERNVFEKF